MVLGGDNLEQIAQEGFFYADKTRLLYNLVSTKVPYFLSLPRRFGKALLVSTLDAILHGKKDLFRGLWIYHSDYNWSVSPIIFLSLSSVNIYIL
jgi:hypothetical protein